MRNINTSKSGGFTLVEMLVIAPIVILMIGGFIGVIMALTGDVLEMNERNKLAYSTSAGLEQLEQDISRATEFRQVSFDPPSPQGADFASKEVAFDTLYGDQAYPTTLRYGTLLILRTPTTTKSPINPTSEFVYSKSPNSSACGTPAQLQNDPYMMDVVYYLKFDDPTWSVWRRIIFNPAQEPCSNPWQRSTCLPEVATDSICQGDDQLVFDSVTDFFYYYPDSPDESYPDDPGTASYDGFVDCINPCPALPFTSTPGGFHQDPLQLSDPNSTSGQNAKAFSLSVTRTSSIAGEEIEYTSSVYATR